MNEKDNMQRFTKIACPQCGKPFPVRILHLEGKLRYSVKCKACGKISEVEIEETSESL